MSAGRTVSTVSTVGTVEEIAAGVYAYLQPPGGWWVNNTGFLVDTGGVVSIDACSTERRTRAYQDAISTVSRAPVRTLINTHHHGDHTFGNYLFTAATIIGQDNIRQQILDFGLPRPDWFWTDVDWGDIELAPPFVTFAERMTLQLDGLRCDIRYAGEAAHTTNDSYVWIPEHSVLFAGDLVFNGGTPFLLMGSVSGAIRAVESLRGLGARTVVPGHGQVCGPEVFDAVLGYIRFVQRHAAAAREAGLSPLEAARQIDLGPYSELLDSERIVGNLHRAYAELDGTSVDLFAALADMVTFNGGKLRTDA